METAEYVEVKEVTTPLPDYFSYNPCEDTFIPKTYRLDLVERGGCQEWNTEVKVLITSHRKKFIKAHLKMYLKFC